MTRQSLRPLVVLLAVSALCEACALAQEKKDTLPAKTKGSLPANWKKLGLTDEQTQKVYKVRADYAKQKAALTKQLNDLKAQERLKLVAREGPDLLAPLARAYRVRRLAAAALADLQRRVRRDHLAGG